MARTGNSGLVRVNIGTTCTLTTGVVTLTDCVAITAEDGPGTGVIVKTVGGTSYTVPAVCDLRGVRVDGLRIACAAATVQVSVMAE